MLLIYEFIFVPSPEALYSAGRVSFLHRQELALVLSLVNSMLHCIYVWPDKLIWKYLLVSIQITFNYNNNRGGGVGRQIALKDSGKKKKKNELKISLTVQVGTREQYENRGVDTPFSDMLFVSCVTS